jgi:hypothetical protein
MRDKVSMYKKSVSSNIEEIDVFFLTSEPPGKSKAFISAEGQTERHRKIK